jgi:exopolysaccharide biosynthesis polyprenyl glycosylphosphotransferase
VLSLAAGDLGAFAAGLWLAYGLYASMPSGEREVGLHLVATPDRTFGVLLVLQVLVQAVVFFLLRLYHQPRGLSRIDLTLAVFRAVSIGLVLTFAAAGFFFPDLPYSRLIPVYDWLATFLCVLALRLLHRAVWGRLHSAGFNRERVLIVGAGETGRELAARIQRRPWMGYEVVGFVDDTPGRARVRGIGVVGRTADLGRVVDELAADEVIIALPEATHDQLVTLVSAAQRDGLSIRIFPDVFQLMAGEVQVGELDGLPLLAVRDVALRGWRRTLKRGMDMLVSSTVLVLSSWLLLAIAILIKLESKGPAFFVQERVGLDGRPFPVLKFRSMRLGAEAETGAVWAHRDDPRRTRVGRFIREWSLDELPQFINVLLGHMSIVGPRPERPEFVMEFQRHIPRYMERHREKAGITGWAQVNGLRGDTSIEERTKYDLYYIEHWSLLFDLKIMAKTLLAGFRDPNAY